MNIKNIFSAIFVLLAGIALFAFSNKTEFFSTQDSKPTNYEKEWAKVDSLENKGLTKSALEMVNEIYAKAQRENNAPNVVKALIFQMKFESVLNEKSDEKSIAKLEKEVAKSQYPLKPVLHSLLAETYWKYLQKNRYKFYNRTQTESLASDDIATWDLNQLNNQIVLNYQKSIEDVDSLKKFPLTIYDEIIIINQAQTRKLRPTLYDFLAHRALDYFTNTESYLNQPASKFEIKEEDYFTSYTEFAAFKIETKDQFSLSYLTLKTLQNLIAFHQNDKTPEALIDVDLIRLNYVKENSVNEYKDSLYFNALSKLENRFKDSPASAEISYQIALIHSTKGGSYEPLVSDDNKWEKKKAQEICQATIAKFPESFGAKECQYLQAQILEKELSFEIEKVNSINTPFRALLKYKNTNKIYVRLAPIDAEKFGKNFETYNNDELIKQLIAIAPIKEFELNLPGDKDYNAHAVEIKIPELANGHYVVLIADNPKFDYEKNAVTYEDTWVSDLSYLVQHNQGESVDVIVTNRESGDYLKGVNITLWSQKYSSLKRRYELVKGGTYQTGANGIASIPSGKDYTSFYFELSTATDYLFSNESVSIYRYAHEQRKMKPQTFFFTDRAIYRPGQTVYFKGILLETDGKINQILPKTASTVTFHDVNGQKISELNLTSNEFGTVTGSFTIPMGLLTGQMRIADKNGYKYISVEEYKRPKFEVTINPAKGEYQLGDSIKITAFAKAYAGAAVDGAKVKYRVIRNAVFPRWWYYKGGNQRSAQMEIANEIITTNEKGEFEIRFKAIPDRLLSPKSKPTFTYTIYADVTDINGETQSASSAVSVGYQSLVISAEIPGIINKEEKNSFPVSTTNLNGETVASQVELAVYKLKQPERIFRPRLWQTPDQFLLSKEEYYKTFPNDFYKDEADKLNWEKGNKAFEKKINTAEVSVLQIENIKNWESGSYLLTAKSMDKYGKLVEENFYFTLFSDKEKSIPVHETDWLVDVKTTAEPGENAAFIIGTKEKNVKILYEIEVQNKIISREWIALNNEQRQIIIPVKEEHRGNFAVHFTLVKHGRVYSNTKLITVPYTNKKLDIRFETFRDKLQPGQQEEWKIKIKGKTGEKVAAEMMATLYDASLDVFRVNDWDFDIYRTYSTNINWEDHTFNTSTSSLFAMDWNNYPDYPSRIYDQLNWFGFEYLYYGRGRFEGKRSVHSYAIMANTTKGAAVTELKEVAGVTDSAEQTITTGKNKDNSEKDKEEKSADEKSETGPAPQIRKNFNETAFFYPQLQTNEEGDVIIKFTIPEALTKWRMLGLAHTKDLKYGAVQNELITQKELMVLPNLPRFFREGDKITIASKISNLTDKTLSGKAQLMLFDALTMKPIDDKLRNQNSSVNFEAPGMQSTSVSWNVEIPEGIEAVTYRIIANANNHTDGEEMTIPVLTNSMLVTESFPLPVKGSGTKNFTFEKLINSGSSSTLKNHKLTLEFTANPAWYAIQALPYLMEYPYECSEQIFSRYYANSIASHIANSNPKIKAVFDNWRTQSSKETLLSNLEKNQELKSVLLEETPWVLDAQNESERKRRVALLFDLNKMSNELEFAKNKLSKMQLSNGGFSWFNGMQDDRYITQHIVAGLGHLKHLNIEAVEKENRTKQMLEKAVSYLDSRIKEDYEWLLKSKADLTKNQLSYMLIHYFYARSYFKNIPVAKTSQKAYDFYYNQMKKYWLENGIYMQGMIALSLNRTDEKIIANDILKSLKEKSILNEELGMYWKENQSGYYWHQAPIETQALLIEAFDEITTDKNAVNEMQIWLLKQKQTQDWKTTKATAEACYALLLRGTDMLTTESNVKIKLGNMEIDPAANPDIKTEAGTGYFKTSWSATEIKPEMGKISVSKSNDGVSWGALYWQYFEQLDKITAHETPLKINKKLFLEKASATGPIISPITEQTKLQKGDKIIVRVEIRTDRAMDYVHLKDMRASGLEPINVISQYKYQGGLGYYESTRDAASNFFISHLAKGTYVFEYPLRVSFSGNFSNGITSIQSMYAPEFSSHSEGVKIVVE